MLRYLFPVTVIVFLFFPPCFVEGGLSDKPEFDALHKDVQALFIKLSDQSSRHKVSLKLRQLMTKPSHVVIGIDSAINAAAPWLVHFHKIDDFCKTRTQLDLPIKDLLTVLRILQESSILDENWYANVCKKYEKRYGNSGLLTVNEEFPFEGDKGVKHQVQLKLWFLRHLFNQIQWHLCSFIRTFRVEHSYQAELEKHDLKIKQFFRGIARQGAIIQGRPVSPRSKGLQKCFDEVFNGPCKEALCLWYGDKDVSRWLKPPRKKRLQIEKREKHHSLNGFTLESWSFPNTIAHQVPVPAY